MFSVFSTPGNFEIAVCVALGLALLTLWLSHRRHLGVYALDVLGVLFFVALAAVRLIVGDATTDRLEMWAGELTNIVLAVFVIATIVARRPFTLAYAKSRHPRSIGTARCS